MDRLLGPLERVALKDIREAKKKQQQRALEGLTNNPGTNRGQNHEDIDIEHALAQRGDGGANSLLPTEKVGSGIKEPCRHRAFAERVVGDEGGDQKQKSEHAGDFLVEGTRLDAAPEAFLALLPDWLIGGDPRPERAERIHHRFFIGDVFIKSQAKDFADVGRGGFANAGDFFDLLLEFDRAGLAGISLQAQRPFLKRDARHMTANDAAQILLRDFGGIVFDLDRRLAGNRVGAHHAGVLRDRSRGFLEGLLGLVAGVHRL